MLEVKSYIVGIMRANCYLVRDTKSGCGVIIDPGKENSKLTGDIRECTKIDYILLTHGHFDHILAADYYRNITDAKIVIGENDSEFTGDNKLNLSGRFKRTKLEKFCSDILVNDGDKLEFADKNIEVIHTPGHTRGSVCYLIDNLIFTGDTLFKGDIGRTDLPTGEEDKLKISLQRLFKMEGDYVVYPGHGLDTTLNDERRMHTEP